MTVEDRSNSGNRAFVPPFTGPYRTNRTTMETKYRTLLQAAVMLIVLICAVVTNDKPAPDKATAQVANSE